MAAQRFRWMGGLLLGALAAGVVTVGRASSGPRVLAEDSARPRRTEPVAFEADFSKKGPLRFRTVRFGCPLTVSPDGVFAEGRRPIVRFAGVNARPEVTGIEAVPGKMSYFLPIDPVLPASLSIHGGVWYEGIYPGIDVQFGAGTQDLACEFVVAPGANPALITLAPGGEHRFDPFGNLLTRAGEVPVRLARPEAYQGGLESRRTVSCDYAPEEDGIKLQPGTYDVYRPLVIRLVVAPE